MAYIQSNINHDNIGSLCLAWVLLQPLTFTSPVFEGLTWSSPPGSLLFTRLITLRTYATFDFCFISDLCFLGSRSSSDTSVFKWAAKRLVPWGCDVIAFIWEHATARASSSIDKRVGAPNGLNPILETAWSIITFVSVFFLNSVCASFNVSMFRMPRFLQSSAPKGGAHVKEQSWLYFWLCLLD